MDDPSLLSPLSSQQLTAHILTHKSAPPPRGAHVSPTARFSHPPYVKKLDFSGVFCIKEEKKKKLL